MSKKRIDLLLIERHLAASSKQAVALLMAGRVTVDGQRVITPGQLVSTEGDITIARTKRFVSRGGEKLVAALDRFQIALSKAVCADVGASTGGFTDVLLQQGAKKVYAIDVGYGDLAWTLRQDPRVVVMERTNARHLQALPEVVSVVAIDVSFISLKQILPTVFAWLAPQADIIVLVKPQFEADKMMVEKGGVVRRRETHQAVLIDIIEWIEGSRYSVIDLTASPLLGPAGNREFLLHLSVGRVCPKVDLDHLITECLNRLDY